MDRPALGPLTAASSYTPYFISRDGAVGCANRRLITAHVTVWSQTEQCLFRSPIKFSLEICRLMIVPWFAPLGRTARKGGAMKNMGRRRFWGSSVAADFCAQTAKARLHQAHQDRVALHGEDSSRPVPPYPLRTAENWKPRRRKQRRRPGGPPTRGQSPPPQKFPQR